MDTKEKGQNILIKTTEELLRNVGTLQRMLLQNF